MSVFKSRYIVMVFCLLVISLFSSNTYAQVPVYQGFLPLISAPVPPEPFDKFSPVSGSIGQELILGLWWVPSERATKYEYCIDTSNDNACSSWISTGTNNYAVPPQLTPSTTYYWQVRAWNGGVGPIYANGNPLSFWTFTTMDLVPAPFEKFSPVDGAIDQDQILGLWWVPSQWATNYEYCIDTTNDNACSNWISTGIDNYAVPPQLAPNTTYYWQVRAWNGAYGPTYASGSPNAFWRFTTITNQDPIQNGGFELGDVVWLEISTEGFDLIVNTSQDLPISPHNGSWLAWLGGYPYENSQISQFVTIPAGRSVLHFWLYTASADYCGYDVFGVALNDNIVYGQWVCDENDTYGWVQIAVDLAAYAGQTVELKFLAGVDESLNSNIWVDDISLEATFSLLGSTDEDSISDAYKTDPILLDVMKDTLNEEKSLSDPDYGDVHQLSEMLIQKLRGLEGQLLIK